MVENRLRILLGEKMEDKPTGITKEERGAQRELRDLREEFPLDSLRPSDDLQWEFPREFYEADSNYRLFDSLFNKYAVPPEVQAKLRQFIIKEKRRDQSVRGDLTLYLEDFSLPMICLGENVEGALLQAVGSYMQGKLEGVAGRIEEEAIRFGYGARMAIDYLKSPETKRMPTGLPDELIGAR